ncbi:MAG TPA: GntR family transcriptional regulator [Streptosporangiaceae bacterium]
MDRSPSTTSLEVPSLVDALHDALRERILIGDLAGGDPLAEAEIASHYSVARPTAKSALERLVSEGLLRRSSNKTARVPILTAEDIYDLYRTRLFLEREVVTVLANRAQVPPAAREALAALRATAAEKEPPLAKVVSLDIDFHTALVESIGSLRLSRLYRSLMGEVRLCMAQVQANHLRTPEPIADGHAALLDLIERGDVEATQEELTAHLQRACRHLMHHLQPDGKVLSFDL